jgi:4-amino-4-deoxy-L-arabinose transferase-like glycosyltransferase
MTLKELTDQVSGKGRGPLFAALLALIAGLPGILALPPVDRDESRFAEASAQMLESGDFTTIMFQDVPRFKKPVGIYWLQALSVKLLSGVERREIWAYRIPSLLGAMLAAGACAWGAAAFLRPGLATMAGALMASTAMLSTESNLAATDAALCGATTLAMAALARLYFAAREGPPAGWRVKALFWLGVSASVLLKGPIGPMVVALTILGLVAWERRARWLTTLGWDWGLILFFGITLPWALAITVTTDGAFWGMAVGGDLAPKLMSGQEGHGSPPGYYALLSPWLAFPASLLLPAGLVAGWRLRAEPGVRFALCWLIPSAIVFELVPTKLPHYVLPLYGALAWLMAAALGHPLGRFARWGGVGLEALAAIVFVGLVGYGVWLYGDVASWIWLTLAGVLLAATAVAGALLLLRRRAGLATAAVIGLGVLAHDALAGGLAPTLKPLWLSDQVARALAKAKISPRQGLAPSPVAVAGFPEPSMVFALGATTQLGDAGDAATAIVQGRPAVVEGRQQPAFQADLAAAHAGASLVATVSGLDYSTGKPQILRVYAPLPAAPKPGG